MAFGGNTHDLGSFGEETDEITDLHQIHEEILFSEREDGVAGIKRRRRDPSSDGVRDLVTASGCGRLNKDLESSTYGYSSVGRFDVFFRDQLLVFQQHQDESLYDSWTRFKDVIRKVPNHGLSIWTLIEIFLKHLDSLSRHIINLTAEGDLRKFSDIGAWYAIEDCAQYDKKCSNPTSAISDETIANPNAQIVGDDMVRVQVPRCMAWLDYDEHVDSLSTMDNEVGVTSPESTTQTLPSFEEYTPPVTYPKEVENLREVPSFVMFDNDWGLESKEVSPLGEELSLFDRPNEVERGRILEAHHLEHIFQQQISQRMTPPHHDERGDGVTGIKRRRRDPSSDGVRDLVTASGRGRLNENLESST
ncbi:hypothetical protein Tco_0938751 [Tanacetum coccineum]|uniref:Uncharacterized protein n=1 Tax=Tanacetum coccineum TaxID=301880 RepID=A0ABQ5DI35_9ASTR